MPNNATSLPGVLPYIGFLIKDVGSRCVIRAHGIRERRRMYPVLRHQNVRVYRGMMPWTQDSAFIAPSALVIGNVVLGHDACVFYHTVIRNYSVGTSTVVGDHTVIMDRSTVIGQVRIGNNTYIGYGASLDCCEVHDNVYIGAGASIALGAIVEDHAIVAAGSAVGKDVRIYAGELWAGNPAQKISDVTAEQVSEVNEIIHDKIASGQAHTLAITRHVERNSNFTLEWLKEAMEQMEKQQQQVHVQCPVDVPIEARRFMQPRVHMRRPEVHFRTSYPVNRAAPWMPRAADQTGNA